jgi:hypothetical protein
VSGKRVPGPSDPVEIVELNPALMSFDVDDVSVEELERRFELALSFWVPDLGDTTCRCPHLESCGTYCSGKPPE